MKINIKRTESVTNYMLVEFSENGVVSPFSSGTVAGVVSDCRELTMIDENGAEITHHICTLTTHGPAIARLSGTAPQNGGDAYINGSSVASTGVTVIGHIVPKPFPESGDFVDGDLVNIVLTE